MREEKRHKFWLMGVIFITFILSAQNSLGDELPYLRGVEVKTEANLDPGTGRFTYKYTITNSSSSIGNLISLEIDVSYPKGGTSLSNEGLIIPLGKTSFTFEQTISRLASLKKVEIVPVGMGRPIGWIAGLSIDGYASWDGGDYVYLKPGQSLSGFSLDSYGLPGIRDFMAEPSLDSDADYYPGWESVKDAEYPSQAIIAKVKELEEKVSIRGKTIGPTAPPADFKPIEFLDYIISQKHEAFSLGWIKNKGIENSLDAKLDNAKKKIEAGDNKTAKNILNAFINEVEAQGCETYEKCPGGKHLTPEAYALLKYHVQYLMEKL